MRISDTKVVQLIESEPPQLVIVDDQDGTELLLSMDEARRLRTALEYFAGHGFPNG